MRVCIVGAGKSGLCAAKYCAKNGMNVTVFELLDQIGGTWVYTDKTGEDEYGNEIQSSMYKNLITNIPKEIMGFPDFPMPEQPRSFVTSEDVLEFIKLYAKKFDLEKFIKFRHNVIRIKPKVNSKWEVIVNDIQNNSYKTHEFDFVFVCNGFTSVPLIPDIPGQKVYKGKHIHSHNYKNPEEFKGDDILIIGAGPSGLNISMNLLPFAKSICLSQHLPLNITLPDEIVFKPDVKKLNEHGAEFIDGTQENFTTIMYCSGFKYSFPFLSMDCGIYVDDKYVQPLYKECINIENPTMAIIGLHNHTLKAQSMDLQVRFVLAYFLGKKQLPTKEEMKAATKSDMKKRWDSGYKKHHAHILNKFQQEYYDDLATLADIDSVSPVYVDLYIKVTTDDFYHDFINVCEKNYKIIDKNTYLQLN